MINLYECHFIYDNVRSRDYGLIIANIETERFRPICGVKKGAFLFNRKQKANELMGDNYEDTPLSIDIEIITCSSRPLDLESVREIERWLFTNATFKRMYIEVEDDPYGETYELIDGVQKRLYFNCRFLNPQKIESRNGVIGFKCTMETDSMMLWQDEINHLLQYHTEITYTDPVTGETKSILLGDVNLDGRVTADDAQIALEIFTMHLVDPDFNPIDPGTWYDPDNPFTFDQWVACDMKYTPERYAEQDTPIETPQMIMNAYVADLVYTPEDKTTIVIDPNTGEPTVVVVEYTKLADIVVDSDIDGYTYPKIEIYTGSTDCPISIINKTDDSTREMRFSAIPANSHFVIDCKTNYVSNIVDDEGVAINTYELMTKKNFLRFVEGTNNLEIYGDIASIQFSWQNRRFL